MADLVYGNAVIGQSGGPTAVINQSLVGVIEGLRQGPRARPGEAHPRHAPRRARAGQGRRRRSRRSDRHRGRPARASSRRTPSAALGSTRDKPDEAYCQKILDGARAHDIRYFFYIGGNDSADTCRIVSEKAAAAGYELRCFHVPKTIDNDLLENDHTPGFPSAARYVTLALMGDALDNASLGGIKINVVMGRNAGFLTAAASLARGAASNGASSRRPARAASHLSARGAVLDRGLPRRRRGGLRQARALPDRRQRRYSRRARRGDRPEAHARAGRGRRPRQCAALRLRRARRRARRSGQKGPHLRRAARPRACAPTPSAISSAAGRTPPRSMHEEARAVSAATRPSSPPRATPAPR